MGAPLILTVVLVVGLSLGAAIAQPARGLGVAVPDFFAPGPVPPVEGVVPEELDAEALANLLAKNAGTSRTALPREAVRHAESALGWKPSDAPRFARLQALGRAVGADRLLIDGSSDSIWTGEAGAGQARRAVTS